MGSKQDINPKCWYRDVCLYRQCRGCLRFLEMNYLIENSGIPKIKHLPPILTPSNNHDAQIFKKLQKIKNSMLTNVNNGKNFYITSGNTGNGKTSWAVKLLLKYFDEVWAGNGLRVRGLFVHVPTLLLELKDFDNPLPKSYKELLKNCDLVVWDDIASTGMSGYDYSQLMTFIDYRTLTEKSNIYTGNITDKEDLEQVVGTRLASRIFNNCEIFELTGEDER